MYKSAYRHTLFALYQLTVALGIVLLPLAMVMRRAGLSLPIGRIVTVVGDAYENASDR